MSGDRPSEFQITAAQAESIASLARLYMTTRTVTIAAAGFGFPGIIAVRTDKWRWFLAEDGRVTAEGALDA